MIPVDYEPGTAPQVPRAPYRSPSDLEVYLWRAAPVPAVELDTGAREILDTYLEFTRFPILLYSKNAPGRLTLTWVDLRFGVPGRTMPFVLTMQLDSRGRLVGGHLGGAPLPVTPTTEPGPRTG